MGTFRVGDIVFHERWDLCLWEIVDLYERGQHYLWRSNTQGTKTYARLVLLGGRALPPDWCPDIDRIPVVCLKHAQPRFNEMEILAMSSMDCRP